VSACDSPLRKPRQQPEPTAVVSDDLSTLDAVIAAILGCMQPGREYARADLVDPLGLPTGKWNAAVQELKRRGQVQQVGGRRGAKYVLSPDLFN
jgi:type I restriction enzyme S subunit